MVLFSATQPRDAGSFYFSQRVNEVKTKGFRTFNSFDSKPNQQGKGYLLTFTQKGFPVISTIESLENKDMPDETDRYVMKSKDGPASIGM